MFLRLLAFTAFCALASPPSAQPVAQPAADAAAAAVEEDLRPLSLVAATAALYHERTGRYPATPFELLGSPEAARTGLRAVQFAALTVGEPEGTEGEVAVDYVIVDEGVERQTEREASMALGFEPDSAQHVAHFRIVAIRDPDFGGRRVLLTRADPLEVHAAQGRLCLSAARLRALPDAAAFAAAAPYFGDRRALSYSFDELPDGRPVASATRPTPGGGP